MADQDARDLFDRLNPIPETPCRTVTESEPQSEWEREQRFWREHPIDRFDLDECGSGYMSYRDMRLNETGEWVRSEDHRKAVEDLAAKLVELRYKLEHEEERRQHAIEALRDDDDPGEALALLEGRRSRG